MSKPSYLIPMLWHRAIGQPTPTISTVGVYKIHSYAVLARLEHNPAVATVILASKIQSATTPIQRPVVVATILAGALTQASLHLVRNRVVYKPLY